jgi:hypothetical protein
MTKMKTIYFHGYVILEWTTLSQRWQRADEGG